MQEFLSKGILLFWCKVQILEDLSILDQVAALGSNEGKSIPSIPASQPREGAVRLVNAEEGESENEEEISRPEEEIKRLRKENSEWRKCRVEK